MQDRVEVSSFEAVDYFRAALIRFTETANAAMASAEVEIIRTISWLETEQLPYWKSMLRTTAEEVEKAKRAYREKSLFKDSTGARHSGMDELKILRKAEAKRAEAEQRALATRRNLRQLQRDFTLYQAGVQQLRSMVNGRLPVAAEELRRVVEQLERYARAAPEAPVARVEGGTEAGRDDLHREPPIAISELADLTTYEKGQAALDEEVRRRTPGPHVRRRAGRASFFPSLPDVPIEAVDTLLPDCPENGPARYGLVTTTLRPDDASGEIYLERRTPVGPQDTGWHIGPVGRETKEGACVTITVGRITAHRPELGRLLALPVGSFLKAAGGFIVLVVDPLGRTLWQADGSDSMEGES